MNEARVQQRRRRRGRLIRRAALSLVVGLVLAVVVVVVPSAVATGWPDAAFTEPASLAFFIDADEMAVARTHADPGRDVLARQTRLRGLVEQSWVIEGGIYMRQRALEIEKYLELVRLESERLRQEMVELGSTVPPPPPSAPVPPPATSVHERTSASRAMLARLPDTSTTIVRSGWPLRAAEGITHEQGRSNLASVTIAGRRFVAPTRPLWLGLAANAVVYALPVLALWTAPGLLRGALRRRRGWCAGCGYELAGLDRCPECGDFTGS